VFVVVVVVVVVVIVVGVVLVVIVVVGGGRDRRRRRRRQHGRAPAIGALQHEVLDCKVETATLPSLNQMGKGW